MEESTRAALYRVACKNVAPRADNLSTGRIAQSVEHSANNAAVQGSSPCMTMLPRSAACNERYYASIVPLGTFRCL